MRREGKLKWYPVFQPQSLNRLNANANRAFDHNAKFTIIKKVLMLFYFVISILFIDTFFSLVLFECHAASFQKFTCLHLTN